jgi:hypothetical protein
VYFHSAYDEINKMLPNVIEKYQLAFKKIDKFFIQRIQSLIRKVKPEAEKDMIESLNPKTIQVIDAIEVLRKHIKNEDLMDSIVSECGRSGLEDNAFAQSFAVDPDDPEKGFARYLVICPGDYLTSFDDEDDSELGKVPAIYGEAWTLAHETGHHIDSTLFPETYEKLQACIATYYLSDLGEVANDGNKEKIAKGQVTRYMSEISADYWGTEAMTLLLKGAVKDPEERSFVLQNSLASLCGSKDDGKTGGHPDGKFRIEQIGKNPQLRRTLRCDTIPQGVPPACTLKGSE